MSCDELPDYQDSSGVDCRNLMLTSSSSKVRHRGSCSSQKHLWPHLMIVLSSTVTGSCLLVLGLIECASAVAYKLATLAVRVHTKEALPLKLKPAGHISQSRQNCKHGTAFPCTCTLTVTACMVTKTNALHVSLLCAEQQPCQYMQIYSGLWQANTGHRA